MAYDWNLTSTVYLAAILLSWGMAAFVFLARPFAFQNRVLALFLVAEGGIIGIANGALGFDTAQTRFTFTIIGVVFGLATPGLYLLFLSTLDTPFVAIFRRKAVRIALAVVAVLLPMHGILQPTVYAFPSDEPPGVGYGPGVLVVNGIPALLFIYGLIVAISAYRRAKTASAKQRAGAYVKAFAIHDMGLFIVLGITIVAPIFTGTPADALVSPLLALVVIAYIPLLAYGVLKSQLFDIDLKIKTTLKRTAVLSVFAAAFFVGSELLEDLLPVNSIVLGLFAAGVIALALHPLQRAAQKFVDRAMPDVSGAPGYIEARKRDVYQAALETAWEDGRLQEKDKRLLAHVKTSLGLSEAEAGAIERDFLAVPRARALAA